MTKTPRWTRAAVLAAAGLCAAAFGGCEKGWVQQPAQHPSARGGGPAAHKSGPMNPAAKRPTASAQQQQQQPGSSASITRSSPGKMPATPGAVGGGPVSTATPGGATSGSLEQPVPGTRVVPLPVPVPIFVPIAPGGLEAQGPSGEPGSLDAQRGPNAADAGAANGSAVGGGPRANDEQSAPQTQPDQTQSQPSPSQPDQSQTRPGPSQTQPGATSGSSRNAF